MKYIIKGVEPDELLEWKKGDEQYRRGRPKYERVPRDVRNAIIASLHNEQGGICCYCESSLFEGDRHVEHLRPQGTPDHKHLSCDYGNMVCSCQFELQKGDPRHCGISKGSWFDEVNFISPLSPDCEAKFEFTFDGQMLPANPNDSAATATILHCQLAIPKLKALRQVVIDVFLDPVISDDELKLFVADYLNERESNNGVYNPFFTTIKQLFSKFLV